MERLKALSLLAKKRPRTGLCLTVVTERTAKLFLVGSAIGQNKHKLQCGRFG